MEAIPEYVSEGHKCIYEDGRKAGVKEAIHYFFYEAGIVRLTGCATMEQCKSMLPNWQAQLKEWGILNE